MPFRCSCGYEAENGKVFAGHLGRYSNFGHRKIGWVDPETGEVLDSRPRRGSKPKQAAPEVLVVPEGEAAPERRPPAEKADARRVAVDPQTATLIRATPVRLDIAYTQQMWTGFQCALRYGYTGDLEDWLNLISLEFWQARGINPFEGVVFETVPSLMEGEGSHPD